METAKASVKKIALNYGVILALLSVVLSVILWVTDNHLDRPWWSMVLSFGIMIAVIVYGLKAFKKENGGFLSLGEALKAGLAISLIAGIIGTIFQYLFVTVIEPEFTAQMLELTRENMIDQNPNMSDSDIETAMGFTEKFMSPGVMAAFGIIGSLFFGFIISLIAGLIMKQNRPAGY